MKRFLFAPNSSVQSCIALEIFCFNMYLTNPWESEGIWGSLEESWVWFFLNLNALCWELCRHGGNRAYKSKEIVKLRAEMGRWSECLFYFILIILLLLNKRLVFLTLCCRTSQMWTVEILLFILTDKANCQLYNFIILISLSKWCLKTVIKDLKCILKYIKFWGVQFKNYLWYQM